VRTRDSIELPQSTYAIHVAGVEVGRGMAPPGRVLALGEFLDSLPGTATVDPVFGLPGKWVPTEMRHAAEVSGATVIDRASVIVTHLSAVINAHAARLLSREDVRVLTDSVKQVNPAAVDELIPGLLSLGEVQRVLQGMLTEQVPINDLPRIYEALTLRAKISTEPEGLIEAARLSVAPMIVAPRLEDGLLRVAMIDPALEQSMLEALRPSELGTQIILEQTRMEAIIASLRGVIDESVERGQTAVLVCAPALRPAIRRFVAPQVGGLPVLSYQEVTTAQVPIETIGVVRAFDPIPA
jgi:flagellar biosynthesis protein FlhA